MDSVESVPHALRGLVLIIAVELRCAQHCFREDGQEAQGLHEQRGVQEEVGDVGRHQREGQHALQVVHEATPRPEVAPVKVWKGAVMMFMVKTKSRFADT